MARDFSFEPVQRGALWAQLSLTAGQVAELTGVSQRQVTYWKRRGFLVASGPNPERLGGDDVDMCVLIKQALNAGVPLRRAVDMAREHLRDELSGGVGIEDFTPLEVADMREKLRGAAASVGIVLEVLDRLSPPEQILEEGAGEELQIAS